MAMRLSWLLKYHAHEVAVEHDLARQRILIVHDLRHDDAAVGDDREHVGEVVEVDVVRENKHSLVGAITQDALVRLPVSNERAAMAKRRRALPLAG